MKVKRLHLTEIKDIYRKYLIHDFPFDERRPFNRIARYYREGNYEGFGGYDEEGHLLCYALFLIHKTEGKRYCLFDYLAVLPGCRDGGIGSAFVQQLFTCFPRIDCLFGEVENPDYAEDETERQTRVRRMDFYLRNGYLDTGVEAKVFGVEYRLLEVPLTNNRGWQQHTPGEIMEISAAVYHSVFPNLIYNRYVTLRIPAAT